MARRILLAAGALVAAVVLFVVLRPDDEQAPPATVRTEPTTTETTTTATTTVENPGPLRLELTVRDGRPVGGVRRLDVERGQGVVLVVRSDVADHVHVHGVDLFRDVGPGSPARLRFRSRVAGVIEIELEDRHLLLAELQVRP
jgi:hypothetical protein